MPCNEAYAAISARLNGKKMAIKIENRTRTMFMLLFFEEVLQIVEKKMIMKISPFFYE